MSITQAAPRRDGIGAVLAANLRRCMGRVGVDVERLAQATDIPGQRIEAILALESDLTCTELVHFCAALGVDASELMTSPDSRA